MDKNKSNKKSLDPNVVIVAVIGLIGTISAAVISVNGNRSTSALPTPIPPTPIVLTATPMPTDTAAPGEPTSTPAPTIVPSPTQTEVQPVALGLDWSQECISLLWEAYPNTISATDKGNGCWSQPVDTLYTKNGHLAVLFDDRVSGEDIRGLFTLLPASGTVSMDIQLLDISGGEVWVGIFESPDINSPGMILVFPKNQQVIQKSMPGQNKKDFTAEDISNPGKYSIVMAFNSGSLSASVPALRYNFQTISVPSEKKYLFVGYRLVSGKNKVDAEFSNLVIE